MKILFTGFTSRTVGSDRNVYDYMSNVFVLERALKLAGHEVDVRPVDPETEPCVADEYDAAVVGIAACQGFASRFKLGALWALHAFGPRAGIFPSDGRNVGVFPSSVKTCLTGNHGERTPYEYFLYGQLPKEKCNLVGVRIAEHASMRDIFTGTLGRLPHDEARPKCDWRVLVPTHSWGNPTVYARHFGAPVATWDPTHVAIPMQFRADELMPDGRLPFADQRPLQITGPAATEDGQRHRSWVISSLQDQSAWIKKQNCKWPVVVVGNKRTARKGEGDAYVPEREMIETYYRKYWGHLAFGYPLAEGGWWRMRYIHAAMAGIVTCCDPNDARRMPTSYQNSRIMLERWSNEMLTNIAREQWEDLKTTAWSSDRAVAAVDTFVKELVK